MRWSHPQSSRAAALACLMAIVCAGCQSRATGVPNPFLAPNRVPPPATRAPLPGQAQPYYPGDPLPVMHSQAAPLLDGSGLSWNSPSGSETPVTVDVRPEPVAARGVNEPAIAIPADGDALRFALAAPIPAEPQPFTPTPEQSPLTATPLPPNPAIAQATYLAPPEPVYNPWRSPSVPRVSATPSLPPAPASVATLPPIGESHTSPPFVPLPIASAANIPAKAMDVRLRAVPAPAPRIRLPSHGVPQTAQDGFRPRGSMR
jgi:hypothetical protein